MEIDLTLTGSLAYELGAWANSSNGCDPRKFVAGAALVALIPFALLETITRLALAAILYLPKSHFAWCLLESAHETAVAIPNALSQIICHHPLTYSPLANRYFCPPRTAEEMEVYLARWRAERVQHTIERNGWINQFLKGAKGNSSLADAQLVFLADTNHANEDVQADIERFIQTVALEGDVLLLEGGECLEPVVISRYKHLRVYGWDNKKLMSQCLQDMLKLILSGYESFKLDKQLNSFSAKARKFLPGGKKAHSELQQKLQAGNNRLMMLGEQGDEIAIKGRNCSLLRAVDESSSKINSFSKIIVCSGSAHLTPELMAKFERRKHIVVTFEAPKVEEAEPKVAGRMEKREYLKGLLLRNCEMDVQTRATFDEMWANEEFWAWAPTLKG